jgi:hypothetical protein
MCKTTFRPLLEALEDRLVPDADVFLGPTSPWVGHEVGSPYSWNVAANWSQNRVPGGPADDAEVPGILSGTLAGGTPEYLHGLVFDPGTHMDLELSQELDVQNLTMYAGAIDTTNGPLQLDGGSSLMDGGYVLGDGGMGLINAASLNIGDGTPQQQPANIECNLFVGDSDNSACVVIMNGAQLNVEGGDITVGKNALWYMNSAFTPAVGSDINDISAPRSASEMTVKGKLLASAQGTATVTHNVGMPVALQGGSSLYVFSHNDLQIWGNANQTPILDGVGATVYLGQFNLGDTGDGNAGISTEVPAGGSLASSGTSMDNNTFVKVYGQGNSWANPTPSMSAVPDFTVAGTLQLNKNSANGGFEKTTLWVPTGGLTLAGTSTLTLYGWHSEAVANTHAIYDTVSVGGGTNLFIGSGAVVNPFWAGLDSGDSYKDGANWSAFLSVVGGGVIQPNSFGTVMQNIPGGAGLGADWSQKYWPGFETMDLVWNGGF